MRRRLVLAVGSIWIASYCCVSADDVPSAQTVQALSKAECQEVCLEARKKVLTDKRRELFNQCADVGLCGSDDKDNGGNWTAGVPKQFDTF